jgi:hypothetical protein
MTLLNVASPTVSGVIGLALVTLLLVQACGRIVLTAMWFRMVSRVVFASDDGPVWRLRLLSDSPMQRPPGNELAWMDATNAGDLHAPRITSSVPNGPLDRVASDRRQRGGRSPESQQQVSDPHAR